MVDIGIECQLRLEAVRLSVSKTGVHQGLLRHSAAVRRPQRKESRMDGMMEKGGREPADLAERPQEAGGDKSAGGPPAQRFAAKRKLRAVSRLLRGEPLELVARELNVTAARGCRNGGIGLCRPRRRCSRSATATTATTRLCG